ncbi:3'-5' exonuclease [Capnocytophaga leadbetteri]|uniref:3'-5' exonuclease n=1 Tax=Capnocytophaga leadbetteri TaxID=327575 RepID=UPI0026F35C8D|nr:3'-5' exonuclease [Capnocytophaga leadbetteri]
MSWLIPYTRLDNDQLYFFEELKKNEKNIFIRGYAGCGKSVLLVHTLIKEKEKNPNANIIIVTYTHAMIDMIRSGLPEELINTPVVTYYKFRYMPSYWDLILVDEVQDLPEQDLIAIKLKGKRIIVAGDSNQSIYDEACNASTIENTLQTQSFALTIIHRISRKIRNIAQFFCADRNGFNISAMGKLSETDPRLVYALNYEEECKWLIQTTKEYAEQGYTTAILIPQQRYILSFFETLLEIEGKSSLPLGADKNTINEHLKNNGLKFQYLGNGFGSFAEAEKESLVTVMTYHSAKGLDYQAVFVPFLSPALEIWRNNPQRARSLFFVALTRSREQLFLSYNNVKHPLLSEIDDSSFHKLNAANEIAKKERKTITGDDEIFLF